MSVFLFAGMFCALTLCELDPCLFGRCELTPNGFACHCSRGYQGDVCDTKQKPCADNPCEGRGDCIERPDSTFHCRCFAWWEGESSVVNSVDYNVRDVHFILERPKR